MGVQPLMGVLYQLQLHSIIPNITVQHINNAFNL